MDQRFGTPGVDPLGSGAVPAGDEAAATVKPAPSVLGTVLIGLFAPLACAMVSAILVLFVAACLPGAPRSRALVEWTLRSAPGLAAQMLLQNALLVAWAWRLARRRPLPARSWLRLHAVRLDATAYLLLLVLAAGVFALGALAALAGRELGLPADTTAMDRITQMFQSAPGISWLVLVLALGLGPGVGEEIWVRGHVLRSLEARLRMRWAIVASAVIFALLHLDPAHMVFALPFGLVFGWLTIRTGSVLPGILCHVFVNSGVNLIRAIEVRSPGYVDRIQPMAVTSRDILSMLGLTAAGVVAAVLLERRFQRAARPGAAPAEAPGAEERP